MYACLGAELSGAYAGGIAAEEVKCRRFPGQNRDGWQYARDIAGEEYHAPGLAPGIGLGAFGDMFQRVTATAVFGQAGVAVVSAPVRVQRNVFDNGAEADGVPDYRFVELAEVDGLGVTAALEVEHGAPGPAVFVVTYQVAIRVGGEGGLAGARESEKQGGVARLADIGAAVHRHDIFFRQQEVLYGKHRLFHLAGVLHPGQ